MQNKDKGDGIEDSPLHILLVILLEGAAKEVLMPSSCAVTLYNYNYTFCLRESMLVFLVKGWPHIVECFFMGSWGVLFSLFFFLITFT